MLSAMTFAQFQELALDHARVAVSREIYGDMLTPITVFRTLANNRSDVVLLDSSDYSTAADACVYLGFDPVAEFRSFGKRIQISAGETVAEKMSTDPISALREFYYQYRCASLKTLAKFAGGMIGFLSYDAVRLMENIPDRHINEDNIPDIHFKFFDTHLVFDKRTGKVTIAKVVAVTHNLQQCYQQAIDDLQQIVIKIFSTPKYVYQNNTNHQVPIQIEQDMTNDDYVTMVEKIKKYIRCGDAFQVVASRQFCRPFQGDDFNVYRALRVLNPSPYQFYLRHQDFTMVGSSPERLVSLQNNYVETMPIAGTRPRGVTYAQDQQLEQELRVDEKEMAEHMMLVDLGRNDLGAVCVPGSVEVRELAQIQRYSRVMHMVSTVRGQLASGKDAFDVLKAVFPAGTLSGAPKVRAMEIIDEVEISRRGIYGGAVCAIDNTGQMDSCITIRTAFIKNGIATVRTGAGVVLDSDPQKEAQETLHKAQAVLDALELAEKDFI